MSTARGLAKSYGTTILLQHNGLPRTPFYAQRHLKGLFENLGVPSSISGPLASLRCRYSKRLRSALKGAGEYLPLEESHRRFGVELSKKLGEVLPEFGPFNTHVSYLYQEPYIADEIQKIVERGTDRLIVVSLYPFEIRHLLEPMRKATKGALSKLLSEVKNPKSGKLMYVANNRPITFDYERLDSIGTHPSFVQYWVERLAKNIEDVDALIFAVPIPSILGQYKYFETVHTPVDRIIIELHSKLIRPVSYRVSFYPTWDHSLPFYPYSRSIGHQIATLSRLERHKPLIIPFGSLFKDFDTEYLMPDNYRMTRILKPDESDSNLVHSFVELLKTRILTEQYESVKTPLDPLF